MYPFDIEIDAGRANEDEYWRINRIHRIISYAQAIADIDGNEDFYKKLKNVYGYKGSLTVEWKISPTESEKEYLQKAWESIVTDYEGNPIEHIIKKNGGAKMTGFNYILTKQISWANRNNLELVGSKKNKGRKSYTINLNHNLFEPLSKQVKTELENGDGGELNESKTHSAKMCAVHSSSAIGVNFFQYWQNKKIPNIAYALGLCNRNNLSASEIHFEQKFEISNQFRFSPNIDVVIKNEELNKTKVFGIECKFSEAYSSRKHPGLKKKYIDVIPEQWIDIPNLLELAKQISPTDDKFNYLHPAQLIKHILGLKKEYKKTGFRLLYLWYDVYGIDGCEHRKEIDNFSAIAKRDNIKFHAISYQELIVKLNNEFYDDNKKYINYLTDRYL